MGRFDFRFVSFVTSAETGEEKLIYFVILIESLFSAPGIFMLCLWKQEFDEHMLASMYLYVEWRDFGEGGKGV